MALAPLPIDEVLPQLIAALRERPAVVLCAPTGAGKTTRVPTALWQAGLAGQGRVVMLEPRRLAARAAATRMATETGLQLGREIGYQVRFENRSSAATRVLVATEGIVLRQVQEDPLLQHVGVVIFDEFHERNLNSDLALAMIRRVQQEVRPDLKILVMSATLAAEPVARWLGAEVIESRGRLYPVEVEYTRHEPQGDLEDLVAAGVGRALDATTGDVLAFLPGVGEIRRTGERLNGVAGKYDFDTLELFGDMPLEAQQRVLQPGERRRVILATNVAETSVTVVGVTAVVDSGYARVLRHDPTLDMNRLQLERISQSSAAQRTGRAGRTAPGRSYRLWTERQQQALAAETPPEIERVDLAGAALELLCWGERDLQTFPWYERPRPESLARALELLERLGATADGVPTELGQAMVRLPVHPRLARLLIDGHRHGHPEIAARAAALLSDRDPFLRTREAASHASDCDLTDRIAALDAFERSGALQHAAGRLDRGGARSALQVAEQLVRNVGELFGRPQRPDLDADEALRHALLTAFADRVARRREPGSPRAVMVGGRGVRLDRSSAVTRADMFVCVELQELGQSESVVRLASAIEPDWLPAEMLSTRTVARFDRERQTVVAFKQTCYGDLVIRETPTAVSDAVDSSQLLAAEAGERFDQLLENDDAARQFIARVNSLRTWIPELEIAEITGDWLRQEVLPRWCEGKRSLDELRRSSMLPFIQATLDRGARPVNLDRDAPTHIAVPSGSRIALQYEVGKPPLLAVRIQEVFGLRETPRVAAGRVPVLLHLLGPNLRVEQITNDLASFWANTYPQVRKELKRRYPKHAWPDDPYTAQAERRPQRKPRR
ncbi:MAG: ATP-dependent helicase HrpB [Planctomycetes bacterium]|nr:ATP-dependent helicase HrpB [Planctomycetota bacterium]